MKLILLSGGSGKRLWPLSNDSRSKQFLKVLDNGHEMNISMVQRVWGQLNHVDLADSSVIATSRSQVDMLRNQLGDVPLIVEPDRRDTFPAISLASSYLHSEMKVSLDEIIAVCPVDHYVADSYFEHMKGFENAFQENEDLELALMGVQPTYPSTKYGYIIPSERSSKTYNYFHVKGFQEKPTEAVADILIQQNALWNCGVFAFRLKYMIKLLENRELPTAFQELYKSYHHMPKISFDYEVVEQAKQVVVLPYEGFWKDLGTWNTLTEEMSTSILGKGKICPDSTNVHIVNEMDIPVIVIGMHNTVVASSPDGILISEKAKSHRIKEMLAEFDQRPMYEERRWGWYRILDFVKHDYKTEVLTKKICIHEGKNLSYHYHLKRTEIWTITKGDGLFILDGKIKIVKTGDVLSIPPRVLHAIFAHNDLEFIEVQTGSELLEEDVFRSNLVWEDIVQFSQ